MNLISNAEQPVGLSVARETYPIAGTFRISRGAKTEAEVIAVTLTHGSIIGRGEAVPYARYGETVDDVLELVASLGDQHHDTQALCGKIAALSPGAARNALDCAIWDLNAKLSGRRTHRLVCEEPPRPVHTAMTISLDSPEKMADDARRYSSRTLIKVKLGGPDDIQCMHAVTANAPQSRIIIDANEGWTGDRLHEMLRESARLRIALIEQPLPAGEDAILAEIPHPVPICADESAHTSADLKALVGRYDVINIKLDKTGGLTEALQMRRMARDLGFGVMVGCMVGTSLAMAPAVLLAQDADYVDLDGPLLLARDREHGLNYGMDTVSPPDRELWG